MHRTPLYVLTLALLSLALVWTSAAQAARFQAAASQSPNPVARSDRFALRASLQPLGAAAPSEIKQADPIRLPEPSSAASTARFRLSATLGDKDSLAVCGLDVLLQDGFE